MRSSVCVVAVTLALLGCGSEGDEAALHAAPPSEAPPATETEPAHPALASRDVTFTTTDGVTIGATLTPASDPRAPAVVLVHQLSSSRSEWSRLVEALHTGAPELTTLAIDMRGHGASVHGASGTLDFHTFDADAWSHARLDVLAAVAFLESEASGVHPSALGAVGSSIGATAVIAAAAEEPALAALVTLSPGRSYQGFDGITPALGLTGRPIYTVASAREPDSVDTSLAYSRIGGVGGMVIEQTGHGVAMFDADPHVVENVVRFLRERLATPAPAPATPTPEATAPASPPSGTP